MSPRLARLLLALAAIPPAYACFVYGWQLVSFTGFAVRIEDGLPSEAWRAAAALGLRMTGIAVALFIVWMSASRSRWRAAVLALASAWIVAAPVFLLMLGGA